MSFMMQPFIVSLGSVHIFILRLTGLTFNTVPSLMPPCGSLYTVK